MSEKEKDKVVVVGSKKLNETMKKLRDLTNRVSNLEIKDFKDIELAKPTGRRIGALAAKIARPLLSVYDGVKEGWKNGE